MKKVKKTTSQSQSSLRSVRSTKSELQNMDETELPELDVLMIRVLGLQSDDQRPYLVKVAFFDQLVLTDVVQPIGVKDKVPNYGPTGMMNYDPSDYEKMCLFADNPLIVQILPLNEEESDRNLTKSQLISPKPSPMKNYADEISCCYVDILPIFIDVDKLCTRKRLQPLYEPSVLNRKSWDNLPLLTMEVSVLRHPANKAHHELLKAANHMKLTLVGAYNMLWPYDEELVYTAATKMPLYNEEKLGLVNFSQGTKPPKHFQDTSFFPQWESLRSSENLFAGSDEKLVYDLEEVAYEEEINLEYFMNENSGRTVIWGSFHRTLLLGDLTGFSKHIHQYKWPLEVLIFGETGGTSMMTALDLFSLLNPGVDTIRLAVPLRWANASWMMKQCGTEPLIAGVQTSQSLGASRSKKSITKSDPIPTKVSTEEIEAGVTGTNDTNAFVIIEVKLARPLREPCIPPHVPDADIEIMLAEMEKPPEKRECTARGQLDRDWQSTVRMAISALRRVPYFGMTDLCTFNRQLSETRTRVEIFTSLWQDAAVYVNNKFVVSDFLKSDDIYEEMLMMSHACLMKTLFKYLVPMDDIVLDPVLRAARHARQMQDTSHAVDLYTQVVVEHKRDADCWRELATCLKDVDKDWALVCLHKSMFLNPRQPLTLISMACTAFEEDPESAELFFVALLTLYPLWTTAWVIANAYYVERQMFNMADEILEKMKKVKSEGLAVDMTFPKLWEHELGDWWDATPLMPGMSRYYIAADLLLRLRAMSLAEVCLARALSETGESAAYYHLVALTCRLRGDVENALCDVRTGIQRFGDISYLLSLEADCLHMELNCTDAKSSYEKAVHCTGPYSILQSLPCREFQRMRPILVDLVRRQPSAYAWVALAENWLKKHDFNEIAEEKTPATVCAAACAVQALKWDRRAGRAWGLLATLLKPLARREHCKNMALMCGYRLIEDPETTAKEKSPCYNLGQALRECRCDLCTSIPRVT